MQQNAPKETRGGYTIQELEDMWRKYIVEISVGVMFALTAIFTLAWGGAMILWSILLCMIAGIIGIVFPDQTKKVTCNLFALIGSQDKVPMIAAITVGGVFSIFLPCVIFAAIGLVAGQSIHYDAYCKAAPVATKKMCQKPSDEEKKGS